MPLALVRPRPTVLEELEARYAELDRLIEQSCSLLRASRCPCCAPWTRNAALELAAIVTHRTKRLDRRLQLAGVTACDPGR